MAELETIVQIRKMLYESRIRLTLIVGAGLELPRHLFDFAFKLRAPLEGGQGLLEHRPSAMVLHNLRKVAYAYIPGLVNTAGSGILDAAYKLEYRGLARTVLAHKTDFVVFGNMEINLVKQDVAPVGNSQIFYGYHQSIYSNTMVWKNSGRW